MKGKGFVSLLLVAVLTIVSVFISYVGIGSESKTLSVHNIKLGLDLKGGAYILYKADKENVTDSEMASAVSLIQDRLDRRGWTEAECARDGADRIRVEIPGVENAEEAISQIGQTAQLQFIDEAGSVLLSGADVADATMQVGAASSSDIAQPFVSLRFTPEGTEKFAKATADNVGRILAIVLDDGIISAPQVNSEITDGEAMITGSFTPEEAEELAALIRAGSLPFNLEVLQMKNVGARLGSDALSKSVVAGALGLALVLIFMAIVYRVLGVAADWALVAYTGMEMLALNAFNVTLTLPGIAGIVLSIGMAVDANVIIFERIKEEIINGKSLRSAVDSGFKRALPAILDGNVTTLIAAVILYIMGTGTIKGFAQTLIIGIAISMFTALVLTRLILKGFVGIGINNPKFYGLKAK